MLRSAWRKGQLDAFKVGFRSRELKILLTNMTMHTRSGSAVSTLEHARALAKRGNDVRVFSPILGSVSDELAKAGIPCVADIQALDWEPQIIHGHHHVPTIQALLCYPNAPAVFVCRDPNAWHDTAPIHPRILRYVGVDRWCLDRLFREVANPECVTMIRHGLDLDQIPERSRLPDRPRRALVFSNLASEGGWAGEIQIACARAGILTDVVGLVNGNPVEHAADTVSQYDIVFARGRSAAEAAAAGAFVVACGETGLGPAVTSGNIEGCWEGNFGHGLLTDQLTGANISRRIALYEPAEAALTQAYVRAAARMDLAIERWNRLYRQAIESHIRPDLDGERRAYLRALEVAVAAERQVARTRWALERQVERLERQVGALERDVAKSGEPESS